MGTALPGPFQLEWQLWLQPLPGPIRKLHLKPESLTAAPSKPELAQLTGLLVHVVQRCWLQQLVPAVARLVVSSLVLAEVGLRMTAVVAQLVMLTALLHRVAAVLMVWMTEPEVMEVVMEGEEEV